MPSDHHIYAGIDFGSGRVTFVALDQGLRVILLEKCSVLQAILRLEPFRRVMLALSLSSGGKTPSPKREHGLAASFKNKIIRAGFEPHLKGAAPKQWVGTYPQDCYRALIGHSPLPRRSLEGRIQRALVLYEQGLQIRDPMDFFEETTRHHMLMGVFPNELLYSASELDALIAAYVAWATVNKPVRVDLAGDTKDGRTLVLTDIWED